MMSTSPTPAVPPVGSSKLTGVIIGTTGSYQNQGNTIAKALDGNLTTYFDGPSASGDWLGLNLGTPETITQVQFAPRVNWASRMVGGIFQGSNTADFSAGVTTLFTVPSTPATGIYTIDAVNVAGTFQYVRYLAPANGYGNVSELEFDGYIPGPPPPPPVAPSAPTNVAANAVSATDIHLAWQEDPSNTVTSFTIERQGPTDATYLAIGSTSGTTTVFDDMNAAAATTYSYEVVANNLGGPSTPALAATATTPAAPISPWSDSDIGAPAFPGSATVNANGSITVTGGGADIWNQTDAFNFESQPIVGNGSIIAKVTAETNPNSWAKSGVMFRETNDADSRYVLLALTPSNGVTFQTRTATHTTPMISIQTAAKPGVWVELVRNGNTFTGYVSTDDVTWKQVGSVAIPMANNVRAGLAVTAHNNAAVCTATFSNIAIAPAGTEASQWSQGAAGPMARWESESFSYNGLLYVFGGYTDRTLDATSECDAYNPATNTWSYVTTMPAGAITHAAVTVVGDTAYIAGGNIGSFANSKSGVATSQVLTFDITTGVWGSIQSLPTAVTSEGLVCINNQLICYGGINGTSTADVSNTYTLDLTNPTANWVAGAAMPDARNHLGYTQINGIAYAIGGQHLYNQTGGNDATVDAYNPVTNTWTAMASLPMTWSGIHNTTLVVNGKIVILGGQTNGGYDGIYLNNIEEYDPTANTWAGVGTLPEANQGQSVAYINNTLIVADGTVDNQGGWSRDQVLLDSEIVL